MICAAGKLILFLFISKTEKIHIESKAILQDIFY